MSDSSTMIGTPFTQVTDTNHQPALWLAASLSGFYSVSVLAVRFMLRRTVKPSDMILGGAYVAGLINWILMLVALQHGVGNSTTVLSDTDITTAGRLVLASVAASILTFAFATVSQCIFVSEVVSTVFHKRLCYASAAVSGVLSVVACLVALAGCSASRYLSSGPDAACSSQIARWIVAGILLICSTCIPVVLPVVVFHELQVPWARKIRLYISFSSQIINIPLLALVIYYMQEFVEYGRDSIDMVKFLACVQAVVFWVLASSTVPCARPVAMKFTTAGLVLLDATGAVSAYRGNTTQGSALRSGALASVSNYAKPEFRHDVLEQRDVTIVGGQGNADDMASVASFSSERQFIRKTVITELSHEES